MSYPPILQLVLAMVAVTAAVYDVRFRRIPNWLTLCGVLAGIGLNSLYIHSDGLEWYQGLNWRTSLLGLGLAFAIYFPLYLLRGMGAGDVKLMAALGAIVGWTGWIGIFMLSNILGGITAVVLLLSRGRLWGTFRNVGYMLAELAQFRPPYLRREELDLKSAKAVTMPHGLAIALGSIAFLALVWFWDPLR
jgi:prepilin peptidase CpaA